ncbi:MAG: GntR family transcriptional regulator [Ardenticatenaceae bacterium]
MMVVKRPKPIVDQVNSILRERIRRQEYPPGGRLPSESELASQFGVSRATVRSVLAALAAEGLIVRKQGSGTFVNERIRDVNTRLGGVLDFTHLIENSGRQASIRMVSAQTRAATECEASSLAITAGEPVLSLVRLFFADEFPAILSYNAIPVALLTGEASEYDGGMPIHQFLKQYCNQEIVYVISDIRATLANQEVVEMLECDPSCPLLELVEIFYNRNNRALVFGLNYYNDKLLNLRLVQAWG